MNEPTKMAVRFPVPVCDGQKVTNPYTSELQTAQQWLAWRKEREVRDWLAENGKEPPLMVYNNTDPDSTNGELLVVLDDRNTALMLKLALG